MFRKTLTSKAISIIVSLALLCTCFSGLVMAEEMDLVPVEESQTVEDLTEVEEFAEVEEELPTLEEDIPLDSLGSSDSNSEELDIYATDGSKVALKFAGGTFTSGGTVSADLIVYNADFLGVNFKINFDPAKLALNTNTAGKATLGKAITCNHYDSEEETGLFYKADVAFSGDNAKGQVAYVIAIDPNSKDSSIQTNADNKRYLSAGSEGLKIATLNFVAKGDITLYEEDFTLSDGDNAFMKLSKAGGAEYYNPELAIEGLNRSSYNITWNLTSLTTSAGTTVAANGAYTATLKANENYKLPETIGITLNSAGLVDGTDYTYSSSSGQIIIPEVKGDLVVTAAGFFAGEYDVHWAGSFNLNPDNNGITDVNVIHNAKDGLEVWATPSIVGNGQITIVGDYIYTYDGTTALMTETRDACILYKINKNTGEVVDSLKLTYGCGFYYAYTCYGEGKIFVCAGSGVAAVDLSSFEVVWTKGGSGGTYPAIQYHDGYLYYSNKVVRASDGTQVATLEGEYNYSSGPFVTNEQGHTIHYKASHNGTIYAFDTDDNWKVIDSYTFKTAYTGTLQPGVAYSADDNRLYWGDGMASRIYSIGLAENGFDKDKFIEVLPNSRATTTCTPLIFEGRVYLVGQRSGTGVAEVFDSSTLKSIYTPTALGSKSQSTPFLVTSEYDSTGKVYLVTQNFSGILKVLEDSAGQTSGRFQNLVTPSISNAAYEQIAFDASDGALYYMNDAGYLMKMAYFNAYLATLQLTGTYNNSQIDLSNRSYFEHNIPIAEGATSIGVNYTLPNNCAATFNGVDSNTGGTVTLDSSGKGKATIVVTSSIKAEDTHTYILNFAPKNEVYLTDLQLTNSENSFVSDNLVSLTPEFTSGNYAYSYISSNDRNDFAFMPLASDRADIIKVKPLTSVGSKTLLDAEGYLKSTYNLSNPEQQYYWVYLDDNLSYTSLEIKVSSPYTGQSKTYQLYLQGEPSLHELKIDSTITNGQVLLDQDNQRGLTGETRSFTVTPDEGYALQTLTATDANNQMIALHNGANNQYSFTMPDSEVTIKAVFAASGSAVRSYNVFNQLTGLNSNGANAVNSGADYTASFTALENYQIPTDLHISMGGKSLVKGTDYTFNSAGALTIPQVNGDLVIIAKDNTISFDMMYLALNGASTSQGYLTYNAVINSTDSEIGLPETLMVKVDGQALTVGDDYSYDSATGQLSLKPEAFNGEVTIGYDIGEEFVVDKDGRLTEYTGKNSEVVIPMGVKSIAPSVFSNKSNLSSITLPATVTKLEDQSFINSTGLKTFKASNKLTEIGQSVFQKCTLLEQVDLGKGLVSIGNSAFASCSALTSVELPATLTSLGITAFYQTGLKSIEFPSSLTVLSNSVVYGCQSLEKAVIPGSIQTIETRAFSGCYALKEIEFNSGLITIGNGAFSFCRALEIINLPNTVTTLESSAFDSCKGLKQINLGTGLTEIKSLAFNSCEQLNEITLPASLTTLSNPAFNQCYKLTEFKVAEGNENFVAVDGVLFNKDQTVLRNYPVGKTAASYTVPSGVTELDYYAFYYATNLQEITLPAGLTTINNYAFGSCNFENILLPASLNRLGSSVFYSCKNLKSVAIPAGIKELPSSLFYNCSSLVKLNLNEGLTTINNNLISSCSALEELIIPASVTSLTASALNGAANLQKVTFLNPGACTFAGNNSVPSSATLYGYPGSDAEAYATAQNRTFVSLGQYIAVPPTVSGDKASVTLEPVSSGTIDANGQFFNVTSSDGNVSNVEVALKEGLIDQVSSSGTLGIQSDLGEIVLGKKSLEQLDSVSGDLSLKLQKQTANFTNSHAGDYPNALVLEISLTDKGGNNLLTSGDNEITLKLPAEYGNKEIYLLTVDGKLVKLSANWQNGYLVANLEHLSTYLLMNNQEVDNGFTVSATTSNSDISGTEEFAVDLVVSSSKASSFASLQTSLNYDPALVQYVKTEALVPEAGRNFIAQATSSGKVNLTLAGDALTLSSGQLAVARVIFAPVAANDTAVNFTLDAKTQVGTTAQIQDSVAASTNPLTVNLHNLVISFASADAKTTMTSVNAYARYNSSGLYTDNTYATSFTEPIATASSGYLLKTNNQGEQLWTDGNSEYSFAELMAKSFTDNASFSPAYEVQNVRGKINFIADNGSQELNYFAAPAGYHLLVFTPDSSGKNYTYNGQTMFKAVNMYNGQAETELFLYFVPVGVNTAEVALAKMNSTNEACQTIVYDKDLNLNGGVNIIDAQIAYDLYTELSSLESDDFSLLGMRNRLEADVNKDGSVNTTDAWSIQRFVMEQMSK